MAGAQAVAGMTPAPDSGYDMGREGTVSNSGVVASVRGSVEDVRFDGALPPIHALLRMGAAQEIVIEVLAQRDARHVLGIALRPPRAGPGHGGGRHRRPPDGARREWGAVPRIRRVWQGH